MGENQTLNYSQGGLLALHQLRAAAGGVTGEEEEIPLFLWGGIWGCQGTGAKPARWYQGRCRCQTTVNR